MVSNEVERSKVVEKILSAKIVNGVSWSALAEVVGRSKEWTTTALLGQMPIDRDQLSRATDLLNLSLSDSEMAHMAVAPARGSFSPTAPPTDPVIYRFYELLQVYGPTFKALIEEEFGDGIMSAIDFKMDMQRLPDSAGDRVQINLNGKFLPYMPY